MLTLVCGVAATSLQTSPVQKVIDLMNGMLDKAKQAKHDEQVQFAAYKQFCDSTVAEKKRILKKTTETIEVLKADIQEYVSSVKQLTKEIADHDDDINVWTGDSKSAVEVREVEKSNYDEAHKDYTESIEALKRAIATLQKQAFNKPQALVQLKNIRGLNVMPPETRRMIDAFLSENSFGPLDVTAPEASGYQFQSQGVIDMLEQLLDKLTAQRTSLEKEETRQKHAFGMLMQDLSAQTEQAKQDRGEKAELKAKKLQDKADATGHLTDSVTAKDADTKYLDDLSSTCDQKSHDFQARQQLRADEIEAIENAVAIIASKSVSGNAAKHLPTLMQSTVHSLAQLRSDSQSQTRARVAAYLKKQAKQLGSRMLSMLAVRVEGDPFQNVKKMIKDLIIRLMEESNGEAEHKGWCDKELATNEQTRKEKTQAVETLHSEMDELEASIAKISEEVADLTKEVAELDSAMAQATELRQKEKSKNSETVKDAQEAQTAVAQALTVLKEFYAKAEEATALLQKKHRDAPDTFDKAYQGMSGESSGVIGMLEVIQADFARLEANTNAGEVSAEKEYNAFMTDSKVDKVAMSKDIEHNNAKKQDQAEALTLKIKDLENTQKELDTALAYFDKLKPSCVDSGVSYEDRVARRKEEIQSLQESLKIIQGEDIA